jgi:hypothetical protein
MNLLEGNSGHRNASMRRLQTVVDGGWLDTPFQATVVFNSAKSKELANAGDDRVTIETMRVWGTHIV